MRQSFDAMTQMKYRGGSEANIPWGVWASVARRADAPAVGTGDIWRGLERRLISRSAPPAEPWADLQRRVDPTLYCPRAVPDVAEEQISEGDQVYTVIRSPRGNYLRLTPVQREIWHQMDGTRTVAQLATQAFLQFKQLVPVGDLVTTLKQEGFLTDEPVGVYRALQQRIVAYTPEGWGRRVLRLFTGQRWQIPNVDGWYGALYRTVGWLLFTRAFAVLWALVALAGLVAFVQILRGSGQRLLFTATATAPLELGALWLALLVSFLLHESAHALAVKHFGRDLFGGGVMLYFGTPAFFVDTSDIWRSPRHARILVSAAGPMSDLFVGGLAALLVVLRPELAFNTVALKLAFTCYIATLVNLNPLLELDGYYMLVDALRLPDLRRRALTFIRDQLWGRLRLRLLPVREHHTLADDERPLVTVAGWSLIAGRLSNQERIISLYGLLTLIYSAIAIVFAVQFWNRQLGGTIRSLWQTGELAQRVIAVALLLLVVLPVLIGLAFVALGIGRATLAWVVKRGYGRQPALLAAVAVLTALLLVWASIIGRDTPYAAWLPPLLWCTALGALAAIRPDYRGAAVSSTINALLVTTVLAALAAFGRALVPELPIWTAADGLAFVFLLVAGLAVLLDVDLRLTPPHELAVTALLMMCSFMVGGAALFFSVEARPSGEMLSHILVGAPAYFGALAIALLLPHLFGLHDSRLIWSWGLFWVAALAETLAYVMHLRSPTYEFDTLAAALWAAAWMVHLATLRQITPDEIRWPHAPSTSEAQRLSRALQFCYASCYQLLRDVYGARRAQALDDRMDVLAATANWDITLDRDRARIPPRVLNLPLDVQGGRYAEVLRYTVALIEEIAGASFAHRAIRAAYDALPWPERETANRYCFPDTPWARELSHAFGDMRAARLRLLRQVDLFLNCNDDELAALANSLVEQNVAAGTVLLHAGAPSPGVWIIEAGEVGEWHGQREIDELHRGMAIGAHELLEDHPAQFSYIANIKTSLLFIPATEFRTLVSNQAPHVAEAQDAIETLRLLERVPLFADMPRTTLSELAHIATLKQVAPRSVIVRQNQPNGTFYLIKKGRVAVLVRSTDAEGKSHVRPIAQLGPEEFFGELELLRNTPPVASVVALTPLELLAFPHAAVHDLLLGEGSMAKGLEQVGTGRLIALRQGT